MSNKQCKFCYSTVNFCINCKKCRNCSCECHMCYVCAKPIIRRNFCYDCNNCKICCACPKIKFFKSKLKFHKATKKQHEYNKSDRFIAAEIEVNSIKKGSEVEKILRGWNASVVFDRSIDKGGFEINTSPANGDLFVNQINEICKALKIGKATVGQNCGLHVHLDARDYGYYDIIRLIKIYSVIEPAIFNMVPAHRRISRYCKPCGGKYENAILNNIDMTNIASYDRLKSIIVTGIYNSFSNVEQRSRKHDDSRYYALNIHSWFYRGTIECRLFEGTLSSNDINKWGMLWATIIDYALNTSNEEIINAMTKNNPYESLLRIVKDKTLTSFVKSRYKRFSE